MGLEAKLGFSGGTSGKEPTCSAGDLRDTGSIPGLGRSPGEGHGNLLQYSFPSNPMDRGAWQPTVHRVPESPTRLKQLGIHIGVQIIYNAVLVSGEQQK